MIADKLQILQNIKENIKTSILNKGVEVGDDFTTYSSAIDSIEVGGDYQQTTDTLAIYLEFHGGSYNNISIEKENIMVVNSGDTANVQFLKVRNFKGWLFSDMSIASGFIDIYPNAFTGQEIITKLNLYNVLSIKSRSFSVPKLKELNLELCSLEEMAFEWCYNLKTITATITSNNLSYNYAANCFQDFPDGGTVILAKTGNVTLSDDEIIEFWKGRLNDTWEIIIDGSEVNLSIYNMIEGSSGSNGLELVFNYDGGELTLYFLSNPVIDGTYKLNEGINATYSRLKYGGVSYMLQEAEVTITTTDGSDFIMDGYVKTDANNIRYTFNYRGYHDKVGNK